MKLLLNTAALAAVLTLAACGGGETPTNNMAADNNIMTDNATAMDPAMMNDTMDANAMGANMTMDANMAADANVANAMAKDATTNDPDTNLANGM
jgi:hypothetical protein